MTIDFTWARTCQQWFDSMVQTPNQTLYTHDRWQTNWIRWPKVNPSERAAHGERWGRSTASSGSLDVQGVGTISAILFPLIAVLSSCPLLPHFLFPDSEERKKALQIKLAPCSFLPSLRFPPCDTTTAAAAVSSSLFPPTGVWRKKGLRRSVRFGYVRLMEVYD